MDTYKLQWIEDRFYVITSGDYEALFHLFGLLVKNGQHPELWNMSSNNPELMQQG